MSTTPQSLSIAGIDSMDAADRPLIAHVLGRLFAGFARRDASMLDGVYSDDADWVNAFGSVKRGNREIVDYLRGLFTDDNFNDGALTAGPDCTLRRLSPDHAIVSAHLQIAHQGLVGGGNIDLRDNRSVRVLSRHPDGAWRIVSEMYMDARMDKTYANHS